MANTLVATDSTLFKEKDLATGKTVSVTNAYMASANRETDPRITAYLRHLIAEESKKGTTLTEIGSRAGISAAHVSTVRSGKRGVGWQSIIGLSRAFGLTLSQLEELSAKFAIDHPEEVATIGEHVVRDERYPNRARAVIAARALGCDPKAIENIQALAFKGEIDPSPDSWLDMIRGEQQALRIGARGTTLSDRAADATVPKLPPKKPPKKPRK